MAPDSTSAPVGDSVRANGSQNSRSSEWSSSFDSSGKEKELRRPLSVEEKWRLIFNQSEGPPMYRAEEYIFHLRKWYTDHGVKMTEPTGADGSVCNHNNGQAIKHEPTVNIVLTELLNISDLLRNLKFDLKLAHVSFVADFIRAPHNGALLLLDFLKMYHNGELEKLYLSTMDNKLQSSKQALADECECLLGLKNAARLQESVGRMTDHPSGMYLIASSSMSNSMKSRVTSLELLCRACEATSDGHSHVLKALSTVRLRTSEPVRFKFLVGMLNSPASKSLKLQAYCLWFLNKLLETSKNVGERVYLQCEMEEAGIDFKLLQKNAMEHRDTEDYRLYCEAVKAWRKNYIDLEGLVNLSKRLTVDNKHMKNELEKLKTGTSDLEKEVSSLTGIKSQLTEQCVQLRQKVGTLLKVIDEERSVRSGHSDIHSKGSSLESNSSGSEEKGKMGKGSLSSSGKGSRQSDSGGGDLSHSPVSSSSNNNSSDLMSTSSDDDIPPIVKNRRHQIYPSAKKAPPLISKKPNTEQDLIIPQILKREPPKIKYSIWKSSDRLNEDSTFQGKNRFSVEQDGEQEEEDLDLNWTYPMAGQQALPTRGGNKLECYYYDGRDMANNDLNSRASSNNSGGLSSGVYSSAGKKFPNGYLVTANVSAITEKAYV